MIHIGKSYIRRVDGMSRLCADITICTPGGGTCTQQKHRNTLWFAIDSRQEEYLAVGRADAFVMVMLPVAMERGDRLVCEDVMSERLHYQLCDILIPALASVGGKYQAISIDAPLTAEPWPSEGAVGTGFSGGVDSLYTVMRHGKDSEYPLTHLAVFNCSNFQIHGKRFREVFQKSCQAAETFAAEFGFRTIFVDTNFYEALGEVNPDTVGTFRRIGCVLALQGLFSAYMISAMLDAASFSLDFRDCENFEILIAQCAATETVKFFTPGSEVKRWEKMEALSSWKLSWSWLHSCYGGVAGERNCGHCKKCKCDLAALYALGKLERYGGVYKVDRYLQRLPENLAYIYLGASRDIHLQQVVELFQERNVPIPDAAWAVQKRMGAAIDRMKAAKGMDQ